MQRVHVFRMIDDRRCLLNHLIISRILDGRNNLLPDCPQGQKLGRIVAGGITVAGKIEVAVVDLIVENAGFHDFQFTVDPDGFPHRFQDLRDISVNKGRRIFVFDFQRICFIIPGFLQQCLRLFRIVGLHSALRVGFLPEVPISPIQSGWNVAS